MATKKTAKTAAAKTPSRPMTDQATFIANINKKSKVNGKKVDFNFVKRKRKPH